MESQEPTADCPLCPRLVEVRQELRAAHPDWFNAPVPIFGDTNAWLAIIGLAPGLRGANRTGRAFTGDGAGPLLFETMIAHGLASGAYAAEANDGLRLEGAIIINAVRCLPPQNKPTPQELRTCRTFLEAPLHALPHLRVVIALGQEAHRSVVKALGGKLPKLPFSHGAQHRLPSGLIVLDSFHCSRYNTQTGRLTAPMFDAIFARAVELGRGAA